MCQPPAAVDSNRYLSVFFLRVETEARPGIAQLRLVLRWCLILYLVRVCWVCVRLDCSAAVLTAVALVFLHMFAHLVASQESPKRRSPSPASMLHVSNLTRNVKADHLKVPYWKILPSGFGT